MAAHVDAEDDLAGAEGSLTAGRGASALSAHAAQGCGRLFPAIGWGGRASAALVASPPGEAQGIGRTAVCTEEGLRFKIGGRC
jgi:hypothetical protein